MKHKSELWEAEVAQKQGTEVGKNYYKQLVKRPCDHKVQCMYVAMLRSRWVLKQIKYVHRAIHLAFPQLVEQKIIILSQEKEKRNKNASVLI